MVRLRSRSLIALLDIAGEGPSRGGARPYEASPPPRSSTRGVADLIYESTRISTPSLLLAKLGMNRGSAEHDHVCEGPTGSGSRVEER